MKLRARIAAELLPDGGVTGEGEDLVQLQAWVQGGVLQLDDALAGKTGSGLLERFAAIAAGSSDTPFYMLTVLTVPQALMARRILVEFGDALQVTWGGWTPAEDELPHLGLKEQALLAVIKGFLRKSAA